MKYIKKNSFLQIWYLYFVVELGAQVDYLDRDPRRQLGCRDVDLGAQERA
jgi:hypothetical protein